MLMLPFTLQQLRILKAIVNEKSFTKAGKILKLSQPYVSKQIKALENSINTNLLNRQIYKLSLTENGKIFLKYTNRILTLCEESCRVLCDLTNGHRGKLKIGATQTTGTYFLPKILALFSNKYPEFNFTIKMGSTQQISQQVKNNEIDLAIVGGEIPNNLKKNLKINSFLEDELNLIVPIFHPFATKKQIMKKDLYYLKFIILNSPTQQFINNKLKQKNIEISKLKIILQLNSIEAIKNAVSLGLGVAFVPSLALEKEVKLQTIKIINIENVKITRTLSIVTNLDTFKSKAFKFFYNEILLLKS